MPPMIFILRLYRCPTLLPDITPNEATSIVTTPITIAGKNMFILISDMDSPTAVASILVATPRLNMVLKLSGLNGLLSPSFLMLEYITLVPKKKRMINANQ